MVANDAERVRAQLGGSGCVGRQRRIARPSRRRLDREGRGRCADRPIVRRGQHELQHRPVLPRDPAAPPRPAVAPRRSRDAPGDRRPPPLRGSRPSTSLMPWRPATSRCTGACATKAGSTMRVKAVPEYQRFTRPSDHQKSLAELARRSTRRSPRSTSPTSGCASRGSRCRVGGTCAAGNMPWPTTYSDVFGHETNGRWFISREAIEQAIEYCARERLRLNVCAMGPAEHDVLLDFVERHGVRDGIVQHGALMPLAHARRWAAAGFRQTVCCGFTWGKGDVYRQAFGSAAIADLNPLRRLLDEGIDARGVDRLGARRTPGSRCGWRRPTCSGTRGSATSARTRSSPAPRPSRCGPAEAQPSSIGRS